MNWKSVLSFSLMIIVFPAIHVHRAFAYVWPMSNSGEPFADVVTSAFGPRELDWEYDLHGGLDISAPVGDTVHSIAGGLGEVKDIGWGYQRGNYLYIYHGGVWSEYLHLKDGGYIVSLGDSVGEGQAIALSGETGMVSGPHLHLGYRVLGWQDFGDAEIRNPLNILPYENSTCPEITQKQVLEYFGHIEYFFVVVETPTNELDFIEINIWLYYGDSKKLISIHFEHNYESLHDSTEGVLWYFLDDPPFTTVVSLLPYSLGMSHKIKIEVDPLNNYSFHFFSSDSMESMGIELLDLGGKRSEENPCSERNRWGNIPGPIIRLLSSFTAVAKENKIEVDWKMLPSRGLKGVNLYRSESPAGGFQKINNQLIELPETLEIEQAYSVTDQNVVVGIEYFYKLEIVFNDGTAELFPEIASAMIVPDFVLGQNYPNPFNKSTIISYDISTENPVRVSLCIYNILGRKVKSLLNQEKSAGHYQIGWDGKDDGDQIVASGIYFYVLKTDKNIDKKKMLLLK